MQCLASLCAGSLSLTLIVFCRGFVYFPEDLCLSRVALFFWFCLSGLCLFSGPWPSVRHGGVLNILASEPPKHRHIASSPKQKLCSRLVAMAFSHTSPSPHRALAV